MEITIEKKKKLVQIGGAMGVIIPKMWCDYNGLSLGSEVIVKTNGVVTITPANKEDKTKKKGKKDEK